MSSPTRGVLRGLRAASLGFVGFVLALVAHVAAGGVTPGPAALLLLAGLISLATVLLTGARLSPVRIGLFLAVMQVVLHEALMWLGAPAGCVMTGASAPSGGHLGHSQQMLDCATTMAQAGMGHRSMFATTIMVGAHVAATAVMAALLAFGEKMLWFLAGYVRPLRRIRTGLPAPSAVSLVLCGEPRMLRVQFAAGGVGRRGPPRLVLFAIG